MIAAARSITGMLSRGLRQRHRHDLDRLVSCRHGITGAAGHDLGRIVQIHGLHLAAAQVVVHAHAVAHRATQQLIDGNSQALAEDVPARLLDAADRAHRDDAAGKEGVTVHALHQVLDAARIISGDERLQVGDRAGDGAGFPFERGFAPPDQIFVGLDLDKNPVTHSRVDDQRTDRGDLHLSERNLVDAAG